MSSHQKTRNKRTLTHSFEYIGKKSVRRWFIFLIERCTWINGGNQPYWILRWNSIFKARRKNEEKQSKTKQSEENVLFNTLLILCFDCMSCCCRWCGRCHCGCCYWLLLCCATVRYIMCACVRVDLVSISAVCNACCVFVLPSALLICGSKA